MPRNVCAQLLVELDRAWQRCFSKLGRRPRSKRKGHDVLGLCEPHPKVWRLDAARSTLFFPKLGPLRAVVHRPLAGTPKTCTIKRDGDQWFVSIICEIATADPIQRTEPVVALDRGVVNLVADSDGRIVPCPRFYKNTLRRLAHAQRVVARRQKGSRNRDKAKLRAARIHRQARRQRAHLAHVLSATYAKSHGTVVVEKLNVGGMTRGNRGLARAILDAGWGQLVGFLRYKLAWSGGHLVEVSAHYSSQTCGRCGHVAAESRRSQSVFVCVACRHVAHADVNAACVLKSRANRSALPVEGSPLEGARRSRKVVGLRVPRRPPPQSPAL